MKRLLFIATFLISSISNAEIDTDIEQAIVKFETILSDFDGDWVGSIQSHELEGDFTEQPFKSKMIFRINGNSLLVGNEREDGKRYTSSYEWEMVRDKTQVLIYTIAAEDAWSESFTFNLTLNDVDELRVLWTRSVSNLLVSPEEKNARGSFHGLSIFHLDK